MILAFLKYVFTFISITLVTSVTFFGKNFIDYFIDYFKDRIYDDDFFLKDYLWLIKIKPTKDIYESYGETFPGIDYSNGKDVLVFAELYDHRDWHISYFDDELTMKIDIDYDGINESVESDSSDDLKYNITFDPVALTANNQVCGNMTSPQLTNYAEMLDSEDPETYVKNRKEAHYKIYWQQKSPENLIRTIDYVPSKGLTIEDHGSKKSRIIIKKPIKKPIKKSTDEISFTYTLTQTFDGLEVQSLSGLTKKIKKVQLDNGTLYKVSYTLGGHIILLIEYEK